MFTVTLAGKPGGVITISFIGVSTDIDQDGVYSNLDECPDTPTGEAVNSKGCSATQLDDDKDGVSNALDQCPSTLLGETADANGCSESQLDADGDGVSDVNDAFPHDPTETIDSDADAIGNNADADDDNDQMPDTYELANGLNPLDSADAMGDLDNDGLSNLDEYLAGTVINKPDTDDDGYNDSQDFYPLDPSKWAESVDVFVPPEPSEIAPPIDQNTVNFSSEISFLYNSNNPVQVNVDTTVFDEKRMSVIRGRVLSTKGEGLAGVKVSILNHPEYGYTATRADGMFDMAVNGGHVYAVNYQKSGHPVVQRSAKVEWSDYHVIDDVMLIAYDTQSTLIQTGASSFQVAQSSETLDDDGARKTTIFFPPNTQANLVSANGSLSSVNQLTIRATEYTVGENGPQRMPGDLPATSGYTFAVELSADEALAAGAKSIVFNHPVPVYVDNFIQFPAGVVVPSGWYDAAKGTWVASKNGRVINVIAITDNKAVLDVKGSGQAATAQELLDLGITNDELITLASTYAAGASLWRVPVTHFTPWDFNWPVTPPEDATKPEEEHEPEEPEKDPCEKTGSIIECENQVLGEQVALVGSNLTLNYRSNRVPGNTTGRSLQVNISGETIPASLLQIEMVIEIAGQKITQTFPALPNQRYDFVWDGLDAYGREATGEYSASIEIGYVYEAQYRATYEDFSRAFAQFGSNTFISGNRPANKLTFWSHSTKTLVNANAKSAFGMGGWSLSAHHRYHPLSNKLYKGDGSEHYATALTNIVETIAGNGTYDGNVKSGSALDVGLSSGEYITVTPDGTIYFTFECGELYKLLPNGTIQFVYDSHCLIEGMDVDGEGNIYIYIKW